MMEILNPRKRAKKANATALKIFFSYSFLVFTRKIRSKANYEKRLNKLHYKNAKRVNKLVLELKGLFVKAGQLMSMMSNVLPEAYGEVLESLQDKAPEHTYAESEAIIKQELGKPIDELFESFESSTIASASIGQVNIARLKDGKKVAVKIQHPYIQTIAEADLNIIEGIIRRVSRIFKISGIDNVYIQVRKMIEEELDYEHEANVMTIIKNNLKDEEQIVIPETYPEFQTKRIIVSSFEEGTKVTNVQQLDKWNIDRENLAERLILTYCKMILRDGFYHADPHPGNILVKENGDIVILDFGAVAIMSESMRKEIPRIIQAIIRKDQNKILQSLQIMGFVGDDIASKKIARKLVNALSNFLQNEIKIDNMNFKDISIDDIRGSSIEQLWKDISIKELSKTMQVPKDWILLDRTMILLSGISATIAPKLNPLDVVKPYLKQQVLSFDGIKEFIVDTLKQQFSTLLTIPQELEKFLTTANNGDFEVTINVSKLDRLDKRLLQFGYVIFIIFGSVMYEFRGSVFWLWVAIGSTALLLFSFWRNRR